MLSPPCLSLCVPRTLLRKVKDLKMCSLEQ
ncbi:rCG49074 [Rattus norvegicus]|uniref:RCG49074 n=1 Tax=Rattus norvegicus TaxID=10116 RepID=A6IGF1_RAT|nr:rCG49074 [Rattus norvegicus]